MIIICAFHSIYIFLNWNIIIGAIAQFESMYTQKHFLILVISSVLEE